MSARRFLRRAAAITIASAFAAATLVACSGGSTDSSTIRIGTTEPQLKSWKVLEKKAKDNDIQHSNSRHLAITTPPTVPCPRDNWTLTCSST